MMGAMRIRWCASAVVLAFVVAQFASLDAQVRRARRGTTVVRGEERTAVVNRRGAAVSGDEGYAAVGRRGGVVASTEQRTVVSNRRGTIVAGEEGVAAAGRYGGVIVVERYEDHEG